MEYASIEFLVVLTRKDELQLHCIRYSDVVGELGVQVLQQVLNYTATPMNMIKDSTNTRNPFSL